MLSDVIFDAVADLQNAIVEYGYVGYPEEDIEKVEKLLSQLQSFGLQLATLTEGAEVEDLKIAPVAEDGEVADEDDLV